MTSLFLLLIAPFVWALIAKYLLGHRLDLLEMAVLLCIGLGSTTFGWYTARGLMTSDVQIMSGQIIEKYKDRVSCAHSYPCNCDGKGVCQTCFWHTNDFDWIVKTNINGNVQFGIERVDSQGAHMPPRFRDVVIGQPAALTFPFTNPVKAVPESLFNTTLNAGAFEKFKGRLPSYPSKLYDYHYVDRVISDGSVSIPNLKQWNNTLQEQMKSIGPSAKANIVIAFTANEDAMYADALNTAWLGGKKNDIIVIFGAPEYPKLSWVRVKSWTDNRFFKESLESHLSSLPEVTPDGVFMEIKEQLATSKFTHKDFKDFDYLYMQIEPSTTAIALIFFLTTVLSAIASIVLGGTTLGSSVRNFFR